MPAILTCRPGRMASLVCMVAIVLAWQPFAFAAEAPEVWRVGVESNILPVSAVRDDGEAIGLAPELMREIARRRHASIVFVTKPWPELYEDFLAERIDFLVAVAYTPSRSKQMLFTDPILELPAAFFIRNDVHLNDPPSLRGLKFAVQRNGRAHDYAISRGWDQNLVFVEDLDECLKAVSQGKADAAILTRLIGFKRVQDLRLDNVKVYKKEPFGFALSLHISAHLNDRDQIEMLNQGLSELIKDGTYKQLREQWLGPYEIRPQVWTDLLPYLAPAALFALAILIAYLNQRRLMKRLRQSEEQLNLVLEGSGDAIWDWDLQGDRLTVNDRWGTLWKDPAFTGNISLADIETRVHTEDRSKVTASRIRLLLEDGLLELEMRLSQSDTTWLRWRGRVLSRDKAGRPLRAAGTLTEISTQKNIEAALRESQNLLRRSTEMLRQAQSVTHIGAWEFDLRTRRMAWSDDVYSILDLRPGEVTLTKPAILEYVASEWRPSMKAAIRKAISSGEPFDLEVPVYTHTRRRIYVRCIGVAEKSDGGRITKLYGSAQDVTERHTAEEDRAEMQRKILETQRLESLGVLSGGIAHDFNNLLTVILSNATFARLDLKEDSPALPLLGQIEQAAHHASDLCKEMLAYSGKGLFDIQKVDLVSLFSEITGLLEVTVGKRNKLIIETSGTSCSVMGDRTQIRQLVLSLVQNAAEACGGKNGTIQITCTSERFNDARAAGYRPTYEPAPGDFICLEVKDDGCGMDEVTIRRIFEPFFSTKFTGRGLGLAAVHGIVRTCRGAITVESTVDRGSTFRIFLPAAIGNPVPKPSETKSEFVAKPTSRTLLVADDESSVRLVLVQFLKRMGFEAILANDGTQAAQLFREHADTICGAILDLNMPGQDGLNVLDCIRQKRADLPVLIMTGANQDDVSPLTASDPFLRILGKPFNGTTLADALKGI